MTASRMTDEQLIAYAAGEMSAADAAKVEHAIASDEAARRTVALYRQAAALVQSDDSVPAPESAMARARAIFRRERSSRSASWLAQVDRIIATLVYDSRLQPALGYRGKAEAVRLSFAAEDVDVDLEVTCESGPAGSLCRVIGHVGGSSPASTAIAMVRSGSSEPEAETTSDERGVFSMSVSPGRYDLALRVTGRPVVLPNLTFE